MNKIQPSGSAQGQNRKMLRKNSDPLSHAFSGVLKELWLQMSRTDEAWPRTIVMRGEEVVGYEWQ